MTTRKSKKTTTKNNNTQNSNAPTTGNTDYLIFHDHVEGIMYIGTCSERITELIKQNIDFINILKTFCCDVILFKPLPLFNVNYVDEKTGKEFSFIVKHINDSGIHVFFFCMDDESDFLAEIQDY